MNDSTPFSLSPALSDWITRASAREWAGAAALLFDAFAPLAVLGAQALYIGAPLVNLFTPAGSVPLAELAALLETPDGAARLAEALRHASAHSDDEVI